MERARDNSHWSLFSPNSVPLLINNFGPAFETTYIAYEANTALKPMIVPARALLTMIERCQLETGGPAMLYKDNINSESLHWPQALKVKKAHACLNIIVASNYSNIGQITQSSLSTETMQYTSPHETAVCMMGSIILPSFIRNGQFNFNNLHSAAQFLTLGLNMAINETMCPTPQANEGNFRQRAIGIGIQGLANAFIALDLPYDSDGARDLNLRISETIYNGAVTGSVSFAKTHGCYSRFLGSPLSQGRFAFDLWNEAPNNNFFNWDALRQEVLTHGVANSVLISMMPTAGTSQFTGCSQSFEPILS